MSGGIVTRTNTDVWLVGQQLQAFTGNKLPSNGEVLRRLFYLIRTEEKAVKDASRIVLDELKSFWEKARIPIIADRNAIPRIEKEYNVYRSLLKGKSRRSAPQVQKEDAFKEKLQDLFDIAHADALQMMTIEEDKAFLLAQREKGRRGYMSVVDIELAQKEERKQMKLAAYDKRREKEEQDRDKLFAVAEMSSSDSTGAEEIETQDISVASTFRKRKRGTTNIVSPHVVSALDRTQVSDRKAVHLLAATAASLGHNVQDFAINRSTIRRTRISVRTEIAELLKESFSPDVQLTVHWDGKLLPDVTGNDKVDRLPVLVSGSGIIKLLGVPKIPSGTGKSMADAVVACLEDWDIKDRVTAMSFDTTASNTGQKQGACIGIQKELGRDLLHLACRHHVSEIVAENAFTACYNSASTGPDIKLFQRFKQKWSTIDKQQFNIIESSVADQHEIVQFCKQQLLIAQPRDDYQEMLELTIVYLGDTPERGVHFRQPGALHRARWMARIIYALKICLFRSQFTMTNSEEGGMKRFAAFVVTTYVQYWFLAQLPTAAPRSDLCLMKKLVAYEDQQISKATVKAFSRHQWYLSETLVPLAFFDDEISLLVKREMIKSLKKKGTDNPPKRIGVDNQQLTEPEIMQQTMANFVNNSSLQFFQILGLPTAFLEVDPEEWKDRDDFQRAKSVVLNLRVVNDIAERGVALMQTYNNILAKNEDQKQYILQVVEEHRKKFPDAAKETVASKLSA